ncbi:MAG TPA: transglutaminaseTgpA domain-containing protein, partial [Candidatus Limnocylindrales bacterium]|nr:transglutaminaseTgpA domain-containing protein [Candidatus Limnocylindrales bacterium]
SLDDARWVLGRNEYLDFLQWAVLGGVLAGFIGSKVGWGRWLTFLIGSIAAALIVPLFVGSVAFAAGGSLHDMYVVTATSVVDAYQDIVVHNQASTLQYLHYLLTLGLLVWATSMFASYAIFGHHRPLSAVAVVGLLLVGNMALTINDQLFYLVAYSLAALFLLIRGHVIEEQSEWLRRRIGDPASISSVYLRGGTAFVTAAVLGALVLTQTASSAPLAGVWGDARDAITSVSSVIARFLPAGGANRAFGATFGPTAAVGQIWTTDSSLALTIQLTPGDNNDYYWRATTYDRIDPTGWSRSNTATVDRASGAPLLDGLADNVNPDGRKSLSFSVVPADYRGSTILSPATPVEVDESTRLTVVGQGGYFATLDRNGGASTYRVTALVPVNGSDPGQINEELLRAAGSAYPTEVSSLYLGVADGSFGPYARELEAKIVAESPSSTPYDLAATIVKELHSSAFTYDTDIRGIDCAGVSTLECFAHFKRGFCQYYAATMAVILRDLKVPTRIAQGFLPGSRDRQTGTERIFNSNEHAWVEVYFPGVGWVTFDPTGGGIAQLAPLPSGKPIASGARASSSGALLTRPPETDPFGNDPNGSVVGRANRGSLGPLIAVGALLLLTFAGLAFVVWQRGPRSGTSADLAYGTVTRLAARFGFGPRPTQTVYEFTGALGEVLPTSRPELETVARAKVESAYGQRILGEDRLAALRTAQRRLRLALLRLAFRRKDRPRRR